MTETMTLPRTDKELRLNHSLVQIEYPKHCEQIRHPAYTFHIRVYPAVRSVSLCIDGGEWRPCRESLGLWWYDWAGYQSGEHDAVARVELADGRVAHSEPRWFMVGRPC